MKYNLKQRIDEKVIEMADEIAAKLSEQTGLAVTQGQAVERAIKELHVKVCGTGKKK